MSKGKSKVSYDRARQCLLLLANTLNGHGMDLKLVVENLYTKYSCDRVTRFKRDVLPLIDAIVSVEHKKVVRLSKHGKKKLKDYVKDSGDPYSLSFESRLLKRFERRGGLKKSREKIVFIDQKKLITLWLKEQAKTADPKGIHGAGDIPKKLSADKNMFTLLRLFLSSYVREMGFRSMDETLGREFALALAENGEDIFKELERQRRGAGREYMKFLSMLRDYSRHLALQLAEVPTRSRILKKALMGQVYYFS